MSYQPKHSLQQTFEEALYHILLGLPAKFTEIYKIKQIDKYTLLYYMSNSGIYKCHCRC